MAMGTTETPELDIVKAKQGDGDQKQGQADADEDVTDLIRHRVEAREKDGANAQQQAEEAKGQEGAHPLPIHLAGA